MTVPAEPVPVEGPSGALVSSSESVRRWHAEFAWLGRGPDVARDVLIEASGDRLTAVTPGVPPARLPAGTTRLAGLTLPGLANAHSHAFHRALRGRAWGGSVGAAAAGAGMVGGAGGSREVASVPGSFWTWRDQMYEVAARLDPDSYYALARATFAEMALAGITCVGEFHYLHHNPDGTPYSNQNEIGLRLIDAAGAAGIRITLLDACYLAGGFGPGGTPRPLSGAQQRFTDGTAAAWAARMADFHSSERGMLAPHARVGAAIHSVRAVPPDQMSEVMAWSHHHAAPVHVHLSEQPLENSETRAAFGATPAEVLGDAGVLGPRSTMVHATHLVPSDVALLGDSQTTVCLCPLTEADLADGVGPAPALAEAGCSLALGSDGHSAIDLLAEARWMELSQRLVSRRRGHFGPARLALAATESGHACLGWPEAGEIVPDAYADLVTVALDSPRLAGTSNPLAAVFAAGTADDVRHVVASGRDIVRDRHHLLVDNVPAELAAAIRAVTD
ncbi:MAG TPA: formimidoylglutamate deiminase [Trebonia sp.]|nr:formimidoylglutamate deiminase [Trebonia sp.]